MSNPWLRGQRKSDLVDLADNLGLKNYESLKKTDLELSLDDYISENSTQFVSNPRLAPYFNSRARATGSPTKREAPELKVPRRRQTKVPVEETVVVDTEEEEAPFSALTRNATNAVARTPARALAAASRIPLPASPADVAQVVDRGTVAMRERVNELYQTSGISETTQNVRSSLSNVWAVSLVIQAFELWCLRPKVLDDRFVFTLPGISALHIPEVPIFVPDMFLLVNAHFWVPTLLWLTTSFILPGLAGYFVNLPSGGRSHSHASRGRPRSTQAEHAVDPLTFSITKALLTYVVYSMGVTFYGWVDQEAVARINSALFGSWQGALTGSAITGLLAIYDAALRR